MAFASRTTRGVAAAMTLGLLCAVTAVGCGGVLAREYEYDEQIDLSLDGSATVDVNASIPALVALRGLDLAVDPTARLDRAQVRGFYEGEGVRSRSRRLQTAWSLVRPCPSGGDIRKLERLAPFS